MITLRVDVDTAGLIGRLEMFKAYMQTGLYPAWSRIGRSLDGQIKAMVPKGDTGLLLASIQTTPSAMGVHSKADAVDPRTGYIYAKIIHDGGYASGKFGPHMISGVTYMTTPLYATVPYAVNTLSQEIDRIIAICGLG